MAREVIEETTQDPKAVLLEETRGAAPYPEAETEGADAIDAEEPLSEAAQLRIEMEDREKAIRKLIVTERERRRRAVRRSEVLERQVQELVHQNQARPNANARVKLDLDDDGIPVLTQEALERVQPKAAVKGTERSDAATQGRESYEKMKDALIEDDQEYDPIFKRLESCTKDLVRTIEEAQRDGETLSTPDDVVEFLETSDMGSELRARYPEVEDYEDLVRAISSNRAARKLAQKILLASKKQPDKRPNGAPSSTGDLTSTARARIREKANQAARSRPGVSGQEGVSIEDAAKMDPETLLSLPRAQREKIKANLRKTF